MQAAPSRQSFQKMHSSSDTKDLAQENPYRPWPLLSPQAGHLAPQSTQGATNHLGHRAAAACWRRILGRPASRHIYCLSVLNSKNTKRAQRPSAGHLAIYSRSPLCFPAFAAMIVVTAVAHCTGGATHTWKSASRRPVACQTAHILCFKKVVACLCMCDYAVMYVYVRSPRMHHDLAAPGWAAAEAAAAVACCCLRPQGWCAPLPLPLPPCRLPAGDAHRSAHATPRLVVRSAQQLWQDNRNANALQDRCRSRAACRAPACSRREGCYSSREGDHGGILV